ncbi:M23 family metallopeptidase [Pedobacter sp. AW1-32]|uniref:M23 family metallopeptidase n=1 Tax=Pedobacter sp. AW1-32 TaxID=3383026 RepID=UPI003FEF2B89
MNKNQNAGKPIQIPSFYIEHWKKYVLSLIVLFVVLISVIVYLNYSKTILESSRNKIALDLLKRKKAISQLDTAALKKRYEAIDQKLLAINKYLKARGIKPVIKDNVGGEEGDDIFDIEEASTFYENYLDKMVRNVAFTPMGYPHYGTITSTFGHRENPFTGENVENHKGLDIRGSIGDVVKSTANGKVIFAGRRGGYGNCIVINHANGFQTYYGHLSKILVKVGDDIAAGDKIGKVGSTGRSTGPHLHYEIHKNGKPISPRSFLILE